MSDENASNYSIQTKGKESYMKRPSMQQDAHPAHNMPAATENYAGDELNMPIGRPMKPASNAGMSISADTSE